MDDPSAPVGWSGVGACVGDGVVQWRDAVQAPARGDPLKTYATGVPKMKPTMRPSAAQQHPLHVHCCLAGQDAGHHCPAALSSNVVMGSRIRLPWAWA